MRKDFFSALKHLAFRHFKVVLAHPISFSFLVVGFIHALLVFYPGSLSVDSRNQFHQALAGRYDDWHPPVMAWVWHQFLWMKKGPQPMLGFHLVMFWGGLYLVWHALAKNNSWTRSLVPLIGLMPPVIAMVGVIWKDIGLGASLLLMIGLWMSPFSSRKLQLILILPLLLYATWVRHNSIGFTAPIFLALPFYFQWFQKTPSKYLPYYRAGIGLAMVVLSLGLRLVFEDVVLSVRRTHVGAYNLLLDLSSIEADTKLSLIPEVFKTKAYSEAIIARYLYDRDPSQLIFIRESPFQVNVENHHLKALKRIWAKSALTYFPNYLKYRWLQYQSLIGWGYGQCRANHYYMPEDFGGGIARMKSWREYLGEKTTSWAATTPLFSGWFYLALSGIGLLLSLFLKSDYLFLARLCFVSTWLYSATFFFGSNSCDFRYVWPTTVISVMGVILLLSHQPKQRGPLVDKSGVNL